MQQPTPLQDAFFGPSCKAGRQPARQAHLVGQESRCSPLKVLWECHSRRRCAPHDWPCRQHLQVKKCQELSALLQNVSPTFIP